MLTDRDRAVLEFESTWAGANGAKEQQIRARFAIGWAAYHAHVARLLDDPEALRHDPVNVYRLWRLRDARDAARNARQLLD